jgi:hypothetical protein
MLVSTARTEPALAALRVQFDLVVFHKGKAERCTVCFLAARIRAVQHVISATLKQVPDSRPLNIQCTV